LPKTVEKGKLKLSTQSLVKTFPAENPLLRGKKVAGIIPASRAARYWGGLVLDMLGLD